MGESVDNPKPSCDSGCPRRCPLAWALGWPYAGLVRLRRGAYRRGLLRSGSAGVPVVCVGNITCGGTGKTPMVAWVVKRFQTMGRSPAILTRGYKARGGVSEEAELLKTLTGVAVVQNPDRIAGAREAVRQGADVLVMDDGFQHLRFRRDLDIVLIDATAPFGGRTCLPLGRLREPLTALRDAHALVVTRSDRVSPESLTALEAELQRLAPQASLHRAAHAPVALIDEHGQMRPPAELSGKNVFAFCGLGSPMGFFAAVEALGAKPVGRKALADHAEYSPRVVEELRRTASRCGAEAFVTTQKDGVKIRASDFDRPVWQLGVEIRLCAGEDTLLEKLHSML
jgi:tetraacyldisaccharide 4'-kinase